MQLDHTGREFEVLLPVKGRNGGPSDVANLAARGSKWSGFGDGGPVAWQTRSGT
jgi:hypothetical protein